MATRKKAKAKPKAKRRKAPARKSAARKKAPAKKTAARKKSAPKKAAAKRAPAKKTARPAAPPAVKPQTTAAPAGERVGIVTHYFSHLGVAVVKLEHGMLRTGDMIHFRGHTTDFSQRVGSLQVNHQPVSAVGPNDDFGMKVIDHAREGDIVYKT